MINIRYFVTDNGACPVRTWIDNLRDLRAKRKIQTRLTRLELGNFGDHRSLSDGLSELRIDEGQAYRIYFGYIGRDVVLLLCGGNKSTQSKDIELAKKYFKQFKQEV
jgi:putative addiction module killer protein